MNHILVLWSALIMCLLRLALSLNDIPQRLFHQDLEIAELKGEMESVRKSRDDFIKRQIMIDYLIDNEVNRLNK